MPDKEETKVFRITKPDCDIELNWAKDTCPGFCPHCGKCIALSSIVFRDERGAEEETYTGAKAAARRKSIPEGRGAEVSAEPGVCPYCKKPIPVRFVTFRKAENQNKN